MGWERQGYIENRDKILLAHSLSLSLSCLAFIFCFSLIVFQVRVGFCKQIREHWPPMASSIVPDNSMTRKETNLLPVNNNHKKSQEAF